MMSCFGVFFFGLFTQDSLILEQKISDKHVFKECKPELLLSTFVLVLCTGTDCKMESGNEICLTQNTYRSENSASDYDTNSLLNDILSIEKENEVNFDLAFTQTENKPENSADYVCAEKSRFADPLSESDLNNLIKSAVPKNTERKSRWAVNVFMEWTRSRKIKDDLLSMDTTSLNNHLCNFTLK